MVVFISMLCGSVYLMFNVTVGLDQELAMPEVRQHLHTFQLTVAHQFFYVN